MDLDYHLRRVRASPPGGRRELDQLIGEIASAPLDRRRPLWEFHFVEGLADGRFALIGKVHHTLADGVASANLLSRLIGLVEPALDDLDDYSVRSAPSKSELLLAAGRDHFKQMAALPALMRDASVGMFRVRRRMRDRQDPDIAEIFSAPQTFLNHVVTPRRTFASAAIALAQVKETAKHLDVTFNDIVLATVAAGLRDLLLRYDGRADQPIWRLCR